MTGRGKKERKVFYAVEIIDTADEGLAIGRCDDGRIVLVSGAVPGDIADVEIMQKRKGMMYARATSFSRLSTERTEPTCSHFGLCGGCKWQHMAYASQLRYKEKKVRDAFQRIGGLDPDIVQPIVGAPETFYYRNKLEYTASDRRWLTTEEMSRTSEILQKDGIGFHLPGAFDKVLDIQRCFLQADPSNDIQSRIKEICIHHQWPFFNLRSKSGYLRNVIIRTTLAGDVMLVLVTGQDQPDWMDYLVRDLTGAFPQIASIHSCTNTKVNDTIQDQDVRHEFGQTSIVETLDHVKFHIGPKSFFQTNSTQAARLYAITRQLAGLQPEDHVYDLYCGVGSLGIYMAEACKSVVGIEQIPEAVEDAKINARLNGLTHTHFVAGQVELLMDPAFTGKYGKPDVVILDPPRAGLHPDVIPHLIAAAPDRIVYVSCNPATQARDMSMLSPAYTVVTAIPVDMFPHTHHIESVALLKKK